jgi:death-on-curing protein
MRLVVQPTLEAVIEANKIVCEAGGNPHQCLSTDKIESAIASAFYPGSYPFAHGGFAKVAGALCFYLVKAHAFIDGNKRTGALTAITFLNMHGLDLEYPMDIEQDINGLAEVIDGCAGSTVNKDELKEWFKRHKVYLED